MSLICRRYTDGVRRLRVDIWSDIACPWCYIGKRRFESALSRFPHAVETEVVWRAFELDPSAPRESDGTISYSERLARKYHSPPEEATAMIARMTDIARADGLPFDFARIRPGNTFDAHRLLHFAYENGRQDQVKERLLRAYLCEGESIGDRDVLVRLAAEAGLAGGDVRAALLGDAYVREVRADESEAAELGISGVPFFVLGGRYAVSGAQPADVLLAALDQAWTDLATPAAVLTDGPACGPDGCQSQ